MPDSVTPVKGRLVQVTRNQGQPIPQFVTAPTWVDVVALAAGVAKDYAIPDGAALLRMTPTVIPTYGNFNAVAAAPVLDAVDGTGSFPVGGQTYLVAPSTAGILSLICGSTCKVTIEVWQ